MPFSASVPYIVKGDGWLAAPLPADEKERLARLRKYQILDSIGEASFDRLTALAVEHFKLPFALISLIDEHRQWFKSCMGSDVSETSRDVSFCAHTILEGDVLVIPDATQDARFKGNPLVTGDMHIRFYAGAPLITPDGYTMGAFCIIDQKPREFTAADKKVLVSLAAIVIDELELRFARILAEEENSRKTQYLSYVGHEIRTPLTTIQTALSLTQDMPVDPQLQYYLTIISEASGILMETINSFLDVARMDAKALTLERIPFRPTEVIAQALQLVSLRRKEDVLFETASTTSENILLLGDPTRVRQIILNFLSNAVKFTERGTIGITSHIKPELGAYRWRVEVSDSGVGIPPEILAGLFQQFQQGEKSTMRHYGGSGLGLHITKTLAELMGGTVGAQSKTGKGSIFWFEALFESVKEYIPNEATHELPAPALSSAMPLRLLLVEDNRVNHTLFKTVLEKRGYEVISAYHGQEAVTAAQTSELDLILMDCQMPGMDGFEATRLIRAHQQQSGNVVPIIAITANSMEDDKQQCLNAGMDDYLPKPINMSMLENIIKRHVVKFT